MAKETLIYQLEHFGFRYPKNEKQTLENINLEVREGDFVLLCGVSGSGKTTLLRHLKPSLAPYGVSAGEIHYGFDARDGRIEAGYVGYVQQNPENQVVTDKVWHELAFGLESLGIPNQEIRRRVAEVASFFGIESWYHKKTNELSGGQMQKLNLASALVMKPKVLVLDEPTSFLDPIAASDFLQTLVKINRELGTTIVMTEHRPDDVLSYASKVVVMEDGKILMSGSPEEIAVSLHHMRHPLLHAMPAPFRIWSDCDGKSAHVPLTVKDGRQWLGDVCESQEQRSCVRTWTHESAARCPDDHPAVHANNIWYRYKEEGRDTLKEFQLSLGKGEILVLMGGNGVGKSTILKILAGIYKPHRGSVVTDGKIGYMPQNPELLFLKKTVREDLYDTLKYSNSKNQKPEEIAKFLGIEDLWDRHPYDLSGGEQHKAALAKILLYEPDILLLDEPTKGLDAGFKKEFSEILRELKKRGKSILMTGHDTEFCADIADRCAMI
ncbi:MAG: ATP-binding cassette domain-containing protein, partial [Bacillota bacterium]|nr:ATP-binding cassette domain-containing protein [Bacillota bacterium]